MADLLPVLGVSPDQISEDVDELGIEDPSEVWILAFLASQAKPEIQDALTALAGLPIVGKAMVASRADRLTFEVGDEPFGECRFAHLPTALWKHITWIDGPKNTARFHASDAGVSVSVIASGLKFAAQDLDQLAEYERGFALGRTPIAMPAPDSVSAIDNRHSFSITRQRTWRSAVLPMNSKEALGGEVECLNLHWRSHLRLKRLCVTS